MNINPEQLLEYALIGAAIFGVLGGIIAVLLSLIPGSIRDKREKRAEKRAKKKAAKNEQQAVKVEVPKVQEPVKAAKVEVPKVQEPVKAAKVGVPKVQEPVKAAKVEVPKVQEPVKAAKVGVQKVQDPVKTAKVEVLKVQEPVKIGESNVVQVCQEVEQQPSKQARVKVAETLTNGLPKICFYKIKTTGGAEQFTFTVDNVLAIGRLSGINQWVIEDDPTISGQHCKVYQQQGKFYLQDNHSTNGTYVNGKRVDTRVKLENHDKLQIGKTEYRVMC